MQELPSITHYNNSLLSIYEAVLRVIGQNLNQEDQKNCEVEVGRILTPFYGGKNVATALAELSTKLKKEEESKIEQEKEARLKEKLSDPDYVPTFEELMASKKQEGDQ